MYPLDTSLCCPITLELFHDPVIAQDGHTYERQAIEDWIRVNHTSPLTRQPLSAQHLIQNHAIKAIIDAFESTAKNQKYRFVLNQDVKKTKDQPFFRTPDKSIYRAEWLKNKDQRPEIILLKIHAARAQKEASFYVDHSRHPHIIRTFGLVYDEDKKAADQEVLLLQEYASQGSFYDILQDRATSLDERILIRIFLQIIDAMMYLASNNIVHGDLACRNILVFRFDEKFPENNVVKLTDFGLSRYSQLYSVTCTTAQTKLNIVPTRYAAPEVLLPTATTDDYSEKSDVYSMGVLMWEAYSQATLPWADVQRDEDVCRRVFDGDILPQPSQCSQTYWSIIMKTWSKDRKDRPTFQELKYLLEEQYYRTGKRLMSIVQWIDGKIVPS
jgi:serine/threonine protein kinase